MLFFHYSHDFNIIKEPLNMHLWYVKMFYLQNHIWMEVYFKWTGFEDIRCSAVAY